MKAVPSDRKPLRVKQCQIDPGSETVIWKLGGQFVSGLWIGS